MTVAEPIERQEERTPGLSAPRRAPAHRASASSDRPLRMAGAACLAGVALSHAFDVPSHLQSSPYLGFLFLGLIGSSLALAVMLVRDRHVELVWTLSAVLAANAMAGYLWSRTIGLPQIEDHVGAWNDAFGTASLVFEATLIGLGVASWRPTVARVASGAAILGCGIIGGGLVLGAAAGHGHGGGGHHDGMNVDAATPAQQAEAQRLAAVTMAVSRQRFPTFAAAQAAGYTFTPRPYSKQKDLDFWHLSHRSHLKDGRNLDPNRPETLMYWNSGDGPPKLMATVYRIPTRLANPAVGGPIIPWHLHRNAATGERGRYKMTHVWHLPGLKNTFAEEMPVERFRRQAPFEDLPENGSGAGA